MSRPRVLFVTNFATHYRAPFFELLHEQLGAEFLFFSQGGEEYWQPHLGVSEGHFPGTTITGGLSLGKLRLNTRLWRALRESEFDVVICGMGGRVELPMTYAAARRSDAAFVLWTGMWMHPRSAFHALSHPATRWLYRHSDAIVTYGEHVSRFVVAEGANPEGVFSAENAVDNALYSRHVDATEIQSLRRRFGLGQDRVLLAVSRLVAEKGLDVLVDAAAGINPPVRLVIVGTGPLASALSAQAASFGLGLSLVEGLSPAEMPLVYAAADVFVMPSVTTPAVREPWGLACNEAMCQGIPIIATDAVGAVAGGLVQNEKTGLVVPEGDSHALRRALESLLRDETMASRLGAQGRARVALTNHENMVAGFAAAIEHAIEHGGKSS